MDEGQVDRTVCYYDGSCAKTWTINVVNCGSFFVYRLQGAPNGGGSYCFGKNIGLDTFSFVSVFINISFFTQISTSKTFKGLSLRKRF